MKNLFSHQKLKLRPGILLIMSILFLFLPRFGLSQTEFKEAEVADTPSSNRLDMVSKALEKLEDSGKNIEVKQNPPDTKTQDHGNEKPPDIKINLNFTDVPLSELLNTLTKIADINIVGGEGLTQKVTMYLKDISLEQALDSVLHSAGYTYIKEGKILRVVPLREGYLVTKVFALKFVSAEQIKGALSGLMSERGIIKSFSKFSEEKYTNTLIVKDTPEVIENITMLIEKLDKKARQVMIEAQFVQVDLDTTNKLGIDWVLKASFKGASGPTTFPVGKTGQRLPEKPEITATEGEITLGQISFEQFTATLEALDTKTKINVISNPRIAARENEEAVITVGDRVPIPTYERMQQTGLMEVTGYQEEKIGVVLKVVPIINDDNSITMRIKPEVSEITGSTGPNNERPIVSTKEISTTLTIGDGKTIVLGGLKSRTATKNDNKVPFLGDIPFVGRLFNYRSDVLKNSELLIFLTPHIIKE